MPDTARIAITLPKKLLRSVERLRRETGESRSALVRRALREVISQKKHAEDLRRYVEGYAAAPETPDEIAAAEAAAAQLFAEPLAATLPAPSRMSFQMSSHVRGPRRSAQRRRPW